jgi:hypothetical protein
MYFWRGAFHYLRLALVSAIWAGVSEGPIDTFLWRRPAQETNLHDERTNV